jgi:hypothetical protein
MVRSDSGAKLVQVESHAAGSLEGFVGALREKLGLASAAQLRVTTSGDGEELTEASLDQIRSKGRGQLQIAVVSEGAAAQ